VFQEFLRGPIGDEYPQKLLQVAVFLVIVLISNMEHSVTIV
jgi:hypothetical protein